VSGVELRGGEGDPKTNWLTFGVGGTTPMMDGDGMSRDRG